MKLWEKTYLLTVTIILLTLYGSLFLILNMSYRNNFRQLYDNAFQTEQSILLSTQSIFSMENPEDKLSLYCNSMKKLGISTAIYYNGELLSCHLPFTPDDPKGLTKGSQIVADQGEKYLLLFDSYLSADKGSDVNTEIDDSAQFTLFYARPLDDFYQAFYRQMGSFLLTAALISILLMIVLYLCMNRIYRPVHNIAHELRTPLTSIQGYAQYILLGKLKEEDIHFASEQIHREAKYMNEIIERLLAMEQLGNHQISMKKIDPDDLFSTIRTYYPSITIRNEMENLTGDHSLLLSLLLNLISNISRDGGEICLTASEHEIRINNPEDFIEPELLIFLNKNRSLPKNRIHGRGLGVPLCHEIVKLHQGTLRYESTKEDGTTVVIQLGPN